MQFQEYKLCFVLILQQSWASVEQHWPSFNEIKYHFTRYEIFDFFKSLDLMKKYKWYSDGVD